MRMKRSGKVRSVLLTVLAFAMVLGLSIQSSLAYFTTYVEAEGRKEMSLKRQTTITEHVDEKTGTKTVEINNTGDLECYVRVKVLVGDMIEATFVDKSGGKWSQNGEWYYYSDIVPKGGRTEPFDVTVKVKDAFKEKYKDKAVGFNVTIIQECATVLYDENGNALPATEPNLWAPELIMDQDGNVTSGGEEEAGHE